MQKEKFITLTQIPLNQKIEADVYFLDLPASLKNQLVQLEEQSNPKFNPKYNLKLQKLAAIFNSFIDGFPRMMAVNAYNDDPAWLISASKIDLGRVIRILRLWVKSYYIDGKFGGQPNDAATKVLAQQVISDINEETFLGYDRIKHLVLVENGICAPDGKAYDIIPMIAMNRFVGQEIEIAGQKSTWMYSDSNEIVTDPVSYTGKKEDHFSFVVKFKVQNLPPYTKAYLNIDISARRWISRPSPDKKLYYKNKKSVYVRVKSNRLQKVQAEYSHEVNCFDWTDIDKTFFRAVYGSENELCFDYISKKPLQFMQQRIKDAYIVYDNKTNSGSNMDSGITHEDRQEIYDYLSNQLRDFSTLEIYNADYISGNVSLTHDFFNDDFSLKQKEVAVFRSQIDNLTKDMDIYFEIWAPNGQEEIQDTLIHQLESHFNGISSVHIQARNLMNLGEDLETADRHVLARNKRIDEVKEAAGISMRGRTIAIVVFHNQQYYEKRGAKLNLDPKDALRVGFLQSGRLTQFITIESYNDEKKKFEEAKDPYRKDGSIKKAYACYTTIEHTILDTYRQIGLHRPIGTSSKKSSILVNKTVVGIHVCNKITLYNRVNIFPFPLIISCNLSDDTTWVDTKLNVYDDKKNFPQRTLTFSCPYSDFPILLWKELSPLNNKYKLKPDERFLTDWISCLDPSRHYELMIVSDRTSQNIISGIANSEIKDTYQPDTHNVSSFKLSKYGNQKLNLANINNVDFLRLRVNDEVPDYIPMKEPEKFQNTSGIYKFEHVFYSQDVRPKSDDKTFHFENSRLGTDTNYQHRRLVEIYPLYISPSSKVLQAVEDVHNLRGTSIQYQAGKTVLPMPLHLGKALEEYLIKA